MSENIQKRVMVLAGAHLQVPLIKRLKELGHYVITVDYLPSNIGHQFGDKYLNIDIRDKDAILKAARDEKIDGIICYATDVAAITAAYVAHEMNLGGNTLEGVEILSNKAKFRAFLKEHGFNTPKARLTKNIHEAKEFFIQNNPLATLQDKWGGGGAMRLS